MKHWLVSVKQMILESARTADLRRVSGFYPPSLRLWEVAQKHRPALIHAMLPAVAEECVEEQYVPEKNAHSLAIYPDLWYN